MKIDQSHLIDANTANSEAEDYKKEFKKRYRFYFWALFLILGGIFIYSNLYLSFGIRFGIYTDGPIKLVSDLSLIFLCLSVVLYHAIANHLFFVLNPERRVLKKIAESNGGTFQIGRFSLKDEKGSIFKQGTSNHAEDLLTFMDGNSRVKFFKYYIVKGYGKNKTIYSYHILSVETSAVFPHMYLNCLDNKYKMSLGQDLSLPQEFEKKFKLSIPGGYHLEALQVFTPDIMSAIMDLPFKSDIEFVDNQMIFVIEGIYNIFNNFVEFEKEINTAKNIISLLKPKIESVRWSPVGDIPYRL